jgi:uncharacterized protein (TIGR02271 family)
LVQEGYLPSSIRVLSNESDGFAKAAVADAGTPGSGGTGVMDSIKSFFHSFTNSDTSEQDYYTRGVSAGGALLAATVPEERVEPVVSLLESHGARDVNEETATASGLTSGSDNTAASGRAAVPGEAIPVVEEELKVGKRRFQRGGVKVYSHIVETPVEETMQLREEHVRVQRTPTNRPLTDADFDAFQERTIELTEMGEEVVVAKEARVVEEVSIGKDVTEQTQAVRDTVRHTEVNVEEVPGETSQNATGSPHKL